MIRMGIVGLETSHAEAFADVLQSRDDATVHGVWDGGSVRDATYVEQFRESYGAIAYDDPVAMADDVDAAMVLTADWTDHRPLAVDFLTRGTPTLVDKPVAGCLSDIDAIGSAADVPLFGGSAVPYHDSFERLPTSNADRTIYAAGYNDYFYYHVHLTDTVRKLVGADWKQVVKGSGPGTTVDVHFENGAQATLRFDGPSEEGTFSVLDVGETTETVEIQSTPESLANMYESYIDAFLAVVRGERDESARVLDSARLSLAAEVAIDNACTVTRESDSLERATVTSDAFLENYSPYY